MLVDCALGSNLILNVTGQDVSHGKGCGCDMSDKGEDMGLILVQYLVHRDSAGRTEHCVVETVEVHFRLWTC